MLAITTLLITGLLIGVGGFIEDQRTRAIESELRVVGQQIAADVQAADRYVQANSTAFTIRRDVPNDVVGTSYTVSVVVDSPRETYLRLTTNDPNVVVEVDMALENGIEETSFTGGSVAVTYDDGTDKLEVVTDA